MKLKTIKKQTNDKHYTKYVFKTADLLKKLCNLSNSANIFFLGYFYFGQVFLCNSKFFVVNTEIQYTDKREPFLESIKLTEVYKITLRIIYEYNFNFYGRDELPLDLPMPDYTKIWEKYHG